jgi:hypothetical protein
VHVFHEIVYLNRASVFQLSKHAVVSVEIVLWHLPFSGIASIDSMRYVRRFSICAGGMQCA